MSDTPPEPRPVPHAVRVPHTFRPVATPWRWWVPGLAFGVFAGLVAAVGTLATATPAAWGTHKATAQVEIPPAVGETALPDAERQHVAFLLRNRELLTRTLAAPEVTTLAAVREWADPVAELERRIAVDTTGPVFTVAVIGSHPDDLKVLLDALVKRFVEDYASANRKTRDERVTNLEKTLEVLRLEIELHEKAIESAARVNGTTGAGDPSGNPARLRDRLNQLETELARDESNIGLLEAQLQVLKQRPATADPLELARLVDADARVVLLITQRAEATAALEKEKARAAETAPVKEALDTLERAEKALTAVRGIVRKETEALLKTVDTRRTERDLADLEVRLTVAKAARDFDREQRDAVRKELAAGQVGGLTIETMRRSLIPQQELADRIATQLVQLRVATAPSANRGPASVVPLHAPGQWSAVAAAAGMTFAVAFVLVTVFRLTGLAFAALQKTA